MVTDGQVRKLFRDIQSEKFLAVAARRAGMDEKTARKYRSLGALPSALSSHAPIERGTIRSRNCG